MYGTLNFPTTLYIFESKSPPETSLTIKAPLSKAFLATSLLNVSIEIIVFLNVFKINFTIGMVLFSSSSMEIFFAPGLVL